MFNTLNQIISQALSLFQWWIVIAPWEMAIRVRRGKRITVLGPGMHFRIPVLDRFFVQSTRKRFLNTPTQTVTTLDHQAVTVSGGTAYVIDDIAKLYSTLCDAQDVVQTETLGLVAEYIATRTYGVITPHTVAEYVNQNLNLDRYGLGDVKFVITDYVCVKTYRLITSNPKDWNSSQALNTDNEKRIGSVGGQNVAAY